MGCVYNRVEVELRLMGAGRIFGPGTTHDQSAGHARALENPNQQDVYVNPVGLLRWVALAARPSATGSRRVRQEAAGPHQEPISVLNFRQSRLQTSQAAKNEAIAWDQGYVIRALLCAEAAERGRRVVVASAFVNSGAQVPRRCTVRRHLIALGGVLDRTDISRPVHQLKSRRDNRARKQLDPCQGAPLESSGHRMR
eukprot:365990-Chlamydomonas_euryale.AAC.21